MNEYDEGRIWYKKKGGVVTVGLTEKAFEDIGGVQGISLPAEGDECFQDDVVCEIEGDKSSFEVVAPVDGSIVSVNDELSENYEVLESDPLDEGWLYKVKVAASEEEEDSGDEE